MLLLGHGESADHGFGVVRETDAVHPVGRLELSGGDDGRLPEQFNRHHGFRQGAENLTWSYAAFLSAIDARR